MNSLNGLEHEKGENRTKNFRRSGTLRINCFLVYPLRHIIIFNSCIGHRNGAGVVLYCWSLVGCYNPHIFKLVYLQTSNDR